MNWIKTFIIQITVAIILFFISDYFYTNYIRTENNQEAVYRIKHNVYHHSLLPSFDGIGNWGGNSYRVCVDGNGFKSECDNILSSKSNFDIAFIGDSFTEAIGMSYEESFVGIFAATNPNLEVANLGVSSYSPTVYRAKLQDFIERGYIFDHVIVFVDISDIQDESQYFRDSNGHVFKISNEVANSTPFLIRIKSFVIENFSLFSNFYRLTKQLSSIEKNKEVPGVFTGPRSEWTYKISSNAYGDLGVTGSINKAIQEMTLLYELLDSKGIKLSVGVYPWPAQISEMKRNNTDANLQVDIWNEFCANRCINFVNMFPKYFRLINDSSVDDVYQTYFIKGDVHYNFYGNRLINETLLELNFNE